MDTIPQTAAAIRDSDEAARARVALAGRDELVAAYIASDPSCPAAEERAMKRRIEEADLQVAVALAALLSRVDHEAGSR